MVVGSCHLHYIVQALKVQCLSNFTIEYKPSPGPSNKMINTITWPNTLKYFIKL